MASDRWISDTLTVARVEIPVRCGWMPQSDLQFYPENPRIFSILSGEEEVSQADIQERLGRMDHVKTLLQSIKANGGLTDPLLVRDGDLVVLEGNSRLAAYRLLAKGDAIAWGMVKVKLLPADVNEGLVFALLGEYHIVGRKDWAPYEQAGYLWRRQHNHNVSPARMAAEMGLSEGSVRHLIEVYSFMREHGEDDVQRWSYYEEYLRLRYIRRKRREHPDLDSLVVRKVKSGEIKRAIDVRDKLEPVCRAGGRVLDGFLSGKADLDVSYDRAVSRGATSDWVNRLKKWREQICDPVAADDFREMPPEHQKRCVYEIKRILKALQGHLSRIGQ